MPKACSFVLNECLSRHHQEKPLKVKMSIICSEEKNLYLALFVFQASDCLLGSKLRQCYSRAIAELCRAIADRWLSYLSILYSPAWTNL